MNKKAIAAFVVALAVLTGLALYLVSPRAGTSQVQASPTVVPTSVPSVEPVVTPSPMATVTPVPLTAEKLLADSLAVMQKVTSLKLTTSVEGELRGLSGDQVLVWVTKVNGTRYYRSSSDHQSDAVSIVEEDYGRGSRTSLIRINPDSYSKVDSINSSGRTTREGRWTKSQVGFQWPVPIFPFGSFATPGNTSASGPYLERNLEGEEMVDGVLTYRISLAGRNTTLSECAGCRPGPAGMSQAQGALTATLWIDSTTLLWTRLEVVTKWDDTGATSREVYIYSDYNKEMVIKPPL